MNAITANFLIAVAKDMPLNPHEANLLAEKFEATKPLKEHAALCAVAEAAEQLEAVAETFTDSELRGLALVLWQKLQALYSVRSHS